MFINDKPDAPTTSEERYAPTDTELAAMRAMVASVPDGPSERACYWHVIDPFLRSVYIRGIRERRAAGTATEEDTNLLHALLVVSAEHDDRSLVRGKS